MTVFNDIMCVLSPLQAAGNAVKRASDNLVRAAQKAAFGKADDDDVVVKTKFVPIKIIKEHFQLFLTLSRNMSTL